MKLPTLIFLSFLFFSILPEMTLAQAPQSFWKAQSQPNYFGAQNQEATFDLLFDILIDTTKKDVSLKQVQNEISGLYKFILGQMRRTPDNSAASYPKYSFEIVHLIPENESLARVTIKLSAKGVFRKNLASYNFYVPLEQSKLWTQAAGHCSPESGVDSGNFWYHWEPRMPGCTLILGVHYNIITAKLNYLPNTTLTFPDYDHFVLNDQTLKATYMFGLESYEDTNWDANTSADWGAVWYRQTRDFLMREFGFNKRTWSDDEISTLIGYKKPADGKNWPTIEDLTLNTNKGLVRFRLFLGVSGIHHESSAFHEILADSLFNENAVFYSGHSGIGKNLDLNRIEKLRGAVPLSRNYQIYFWGGCVPYSYYTDMFFSRKQNLMDPQGTEKLDIVAYGNESAFTADDDTRLIAALVNYMTGTKRTSYQEIIGNADRFFLGVNGDEDNPTENLIKD